MPRNLDRDISEVPQSQAVQLDANVAQCLVPQPKGIQYSQCAATVHFNMTRTPRCHWVFKQLQGDVGNVAAVRVQVFRARRGPIATA